MTFRFRPVALAVAMVASLGLLGAKCNGANTDNGRIHKIETGLAQVSGLANKVNDQVTTLQSKGQGLDGDMASVTNSLDDLKKQVDALKTADPAMQKKIDDLSAKLTALQSKVNDIDQRLWVLQARFDDHIRKSGG